MAQSLEVVELQARMEQSQQAQFRKPMVSPSASREVFAAFELL
jgi:hypothetical protein